MFVAQSLYYLETYLKVAKLEPRQGDLVFIFETQTHWEFDWVNWKDTRTQIRPMWEIWPEGRAGKDGVRGFNGRDWKDGEKGKQWEPGLPGKDWVNGVSPELEDVVNMLMDNEEFTEMCKWEKGEKGDSIQGEKWDDWKDAEIDYDKLVEILKNDHQFIQATTGPKGERWDKGETGKGWGQPGRDWVDGRDGKDGKVQMILLVKWLYEEIGNDGDFCMDIDTKRVYEKVDGVRVFRY